LTLFRVNPDLDLPAFAASYAATGHVRIPNLLAAGAEPMHDHLKNREDWLQLVSTREEVLELSRPKRARMSGKRRAALDAEVHERARFGFQYRYEGLRMPEEDEEEWESDNDPLTEFARLLASEELLAMLGTVLDHDALRFADGQATAYGPGDFLTCHDDNAPGKNRVAACVFGFTPRWRTEWGGLLFFHDRYGDPTGAHRPGFNTLDLFKVPRLHSVSFVTPAAAGLRYSVTGWLNAPLT
jgi:SM-20-related protein